MDRLYQVVSQTQPHSPSPPRVQAAPSAVPTAFCCPMYRSTFSLVSGIACSGSLPFEPALYIVIPLRYGI